MDVNYVDDEREGGQYFVVVQIRYLLYRYVKQSVLDSLQNYEIQFGRRDYRARMRGYLEAIHSLLHVSSDSWSK